MTNTPIQYTKCSIHTIWLINGLCSWCRKPKNNYECPHYDAGYCTYCSSLKEITDEV